MRPTLPRPLPVDFEITENFQLHETEAGADLGGPAPVHAYFQVGALAWMLQMFRYEFGAMKVNSWTRPGATVKTASGKKVASAHAASAAADIRFLECDRSEPTNWLLEEWSLGGLEGAAYRRRHKGASLVRRRIDLLPLDKVITYEDTRHMHIQVRILRPPRHQIRVHLAEGKQHGTSYPLWADYTGRLKDPSTGLALA